MHLEKQISRETLFYYPILVYSRLTALLKYPTVHQGHCLGI